MDYLISILIASWDVMIQLSPSLLLGLFLAGLLHVFLPAGFVSKNLSKTNHTSVLKAVLIGVPMPLCSCGVVPTAIGLQNDGASKGAVTGFLISTPQTGVDSIMVAASFLGWPFALFKVAAAFVTGVLGGILVNRFVPSDTRDKQPNLVPIHSPGFIARLFEAVRFAIVDLLAMIDVWIVFGVLVSAMISVYIPPGTFAESTWTQGPLGMLVVLLVALPLYICTTGSVPIAAALIMAGLPIGSALVFLMAGPATNVATMGAILRALGARVLAIYLGVVIIGSILFGLLFDFLITMPSAVDHTHQHHSSSWLDISAAAFTSLLLAGLIIKRLFQRVKNHLGASKNHSDMKLTIQGMSCQHCVATVTKALINAPGVERASVDLALGMAYIDGDDLDRSSLVQAVEQAGFKVKK